jgi:hypothetical protein
MPHPDLLGVGALGAKTFLWSIINENIFKIIPVSKLDLFIGFSSTDDFSGFLA